MNIVNSKSILIRLPSFSRRGCGMGVTNLPKRTARPGFTRVLPAGQSPAGRGSQIDWHVVCKPVCINPRTYILFPLQKKCTVRKAKSPARRTRAEVDESAILEPSPRSIAKQQYPYLEREKTRPKITRREARAQSWSGKHKDGHCMIICKSQRLAMPLSISHLQRRRIFHS